MFEFIDTHPWLLPFMIFFGRICDVTLGTLRIIFVSKGERYKAPLVGFFEVFIWIVIISQVLARANDIVAYLAYAGGYASGTYVGMYIERRMALGVVLIRVFTKKSGKELAVLLNSRGHGSTCMQGEGALGKVDVVETVVSRKLMRFVEELISSYDPEAFYIVEDIRTKQRGIFSKTPSFFAYRRPGK